MRFFDVNAMIGPCFAPRDGHYPQAEDLLSDMDLYGIDQALVYHGLAYEYHGMTGNRELMKSISANRRLKAGWIVGLHQVGQYPPPGELVAELLASGAVAARFFWGGLLTETSFPDLEAHEMLWGALESHCIPTIVTFDETAVITGLQMAQLAVMLKNFPRLPVILSLGKYAKDFAVLFDKLERYHNLHLDAAVLMLEGIIEDIVQRFGAERILFGSNFPWFKGGQTRIALSYADISGEEKQMIAGKNLVGLIGGIKR